MPYRHVASALPARVEALRSRHAALSLKIETEQTRPSTSDWYLRDLKRQKLRIKEELESIKDGTSH